MVGTTTQPGRLRPSRHSTTGCLTRRLVLAATAWLLCGATAAPASAPDPGGSETAPFNGPHAGEYFGFAGVRHFGEPDPATAAAQVASVRGNMTRTAMHWSGMEPRRDWYDENVFARYERLYDALRGRQITPILMVQFAPAWARDEGAPKNCGTSDSCHYPPSRAMYEEWREFIAELARRFPAAALEIWNEPNYLGQWRPEPEPERYAELLAEARAAAHSVNPGMMVLAGGLGMEPKPGWIEGGEYLRRAYAASPSLKGNTDALNFHAYPKNDMGAGSTFAEMFATVREARRAAGDNETPLLITELGATTTGPGAINEDEQAQRVMRALRRIYSMEDTLGALVYTLADRNELATTNAEHGFGVVRAKAGLLGSNIEPKLAYCSLRRATANTLLDTDCPPETEISAGPAPIGSGDDVRFEFSSPDATATGFECSLDGSPFASCRSPVAYEGVAPGPHAFAVRAQDVLGRHDPYPARWPFAVDRDDRRLEVAVDPARSRTRARGRAVKLRVEVTNPGAPLPTTGVEVCAKAKRKLLRLPRKPCRRIADIPPGGVGSLRLKVKPRPRAAGRAADVRFVARADRTLPGKARARIKIR
jgi:hypothetical protein